MSEDPLIDILDIGGNQKALKALENLTSTDREIIIQLSKLTAQEIEYYSMLIDLGADHNLTWMVDLSYREIAMLKSHDGWMVKTISAILEKWGNVAKGIGNSVGQVNETITKAFNE